MTSLVARQPEDLIVTIKIRRDVPDALTGQSHYGDVIADTIHYAIRPLDEVATRLEIKWGCERLPGLVSPETAARFGAAKARLDRAIMDNDGPEVVKRAAVLLRGWEALDAEAARRSHQPLQPHVWSHTTDAGFRFAVAQGNADALKALRVSNALRGVAVYSLDEIGRILEIDSLALVRAAEAVRRALPHAVVEGAEAAAWEGQASARPQGGGNVPF